MLKTQVTANSLLATAAQCPAGLEGSGGPKAATPARSTDVPPKPTACPRFLPTQKRPAGRGRGQPAQREAHSVFIVRGHHHCSPGIVLQLLQDVVEAPGEGDV